MTEEEKKAKRAEQARRWRAEHPGSDKRTADERREWKRTHREANRERLNAEHAAYMRAHPEQRAKLAEYGRRRRGLHPDQKQSRDPVIRKQRVRDREKFNAYQREWKRKNPERARAIARRTNLKAKYGITPEEFDAVLAQQEGRCAICRSKDPGGHTRRKGERGEFHVDHDHATGERRGLLCRKCNAGIGQLGDSVERLEAALEYLRKHQT